MELMIDYRCTICTSDSQAHLFGNLLYDLGQDELPGSSLLERMAALNALPLGYIILSVARA